MGRNLKLFLDFKYLLVALPLFAFTCNEKNEVYAEPGKKINNKLLVVVDQSASISYKKRDTQIKPFISEVFNETYKNVITPTEYYVSDITTETNVVAKPSRFDHVYPNATSLGGVGFKTKLGQWRVQRNKWINGGVESIYKSVLTDKKAYTDVYGSIQTLDMVGDGLDQHDTLNVVFFSDMKQSTRNYELVHFLKSKVPTAFAKDEFKRVSNEKGIRKLNDRFHCNIVIITPDNFDNSGTIVQYWDTFFKEWGIKSRVKWM